MDRLKISILLSFFFFNSIIAVKAQDFSQETVMNFIKDYLKEKAKYTGHVDLYDEKINKVRNLDLLSMDKEAKEENNQYAVHGKFRDVSSGDVASLKILVKKNDAKLEMGTLEVESVEKSEGVNAVDPARQITDAEVKDIIQKYFEQKSKFTGTFDMFDDKTQKMRNLKIGVLQENIRRFGTRYIGRADAEDGVSQEKLELDISVDNKDGVLDVKNVKIFSVNNVQR